MSAAPPGGSTTRAGPQQLNKPGLIEGSYAGDFRLTAATDNAGLLD